MALSATVVVCIGTFAVRSDLGLLPRAGASHADATVGANGYPPPPDNLSAERLAPAVAPTTTGPHTFQHTRPDGSPVGYDPCRPLRYVVNPAQSPPGGMQMVREAVDQVARATGLVFREDGLTSERAADDRSPYQPDRYGERWAPVLIAWGDERSYDLLGGDVAGFGGSHMIASAGPGSERLVSGQVVLDADAYAEMAERQGSHESGRAIIAHELGHVVGLGHVDDPTELMHEGNSGQVVFGPGDLEGLARLGAGPCFTDT